MKANSICKIPKPPKSASAGPSMDDSTLEVRNSVASSILVGTSMEMVLSRIRDGIVVCDSLGWIQLANAGARRLATQNPEGRPIRLAQDIWGELLDPDGSRIGLQEWPVLRALRGETRSDEECRLVHPDGSCFDVLFSANPIVDSAGRVLGAMATLTDISSHKNREAAEREQALERERSRMATHIHDTVSQSLTAIALQVQAAEGDLGDDPERADAYLQRALGLARDGLAELRRCIWTLSHESLESEDLAESLSFLAERLFAATPIELELSLQPETASLPREIRHEILWISKEALANILKHANATRVRIELLCGAKDVQLSVADNGRGFGSLRVPRANGSFGLISMRKRAARLGGTVSVDSRPGHGTKVVAIVPRIRYRAVAA